MANCSICSAGDKKLFKGSYYDHQVFVCKRCVFAYSVDIEQAKESA